MFYPERIFSDEQEALIVAAIRAFERKTSAEMRVHVEHRLRRPPLDEAVAVFAALNMHRTELRNGVLFLLAPGQHSFAIYGDIGINARVPADFWESTRNLMQPYFAAGDFTAGLIAGIGAAGEALTSHFPWREDDINELPDDISYG